MNRVTRPAACIGAGAALAMLIAGCGKSDAPAPGISAKQTTAASDQSVSAEVVAKQARRAVLSGKDHVAGARRQRAG